MPSIGPELPPHLQKRKRTPEDDMSHVAPRAKATRRENQDEIDLDDGSSDDGFGPGPAPPALESHKPTISGPSIGPTRPPQPSEQDKSSGSTGPKPPIGPTLPPSLSTNQDEIPLNDESSDSDTGPAPPSKIGPAAPPTTKRILGPAPPPAPLSERPTQDPDPDSDTDSDSDWGPALPSAANRPSSGPALPTPSALLPPEEPAVPKRDDWMLAPPTSSGYRAPDPTKLKSRKFASGRSAADKPSGGGGGVSSIWTETPEEKARRIANAVLGREDPSASAPSSSTAGSTKKPSSSTRRADEDKIRAFTEQTRGRSLVEEHQAARDAGRDRAGVLKPGEEEEDDPSKRAFDWEKDMKVGGQISNSQKRQLLNRAANFGGRFQKGSFL
ncbi:GPALPP motifs-containing protein 1 [Echria macrotheca]|uniref:GPALPP motifs-containing protein 1 n=1 Tax=Echria macrotheca TaxID=438768 RepID=A0AAJ0BFM5_9PEZI|nr:GPALPP motifs-containing protein 1 [Echria macrotheca]